jgi:hypothetical protein
MKAKRTYEMSSQAITAAQGLVMTWRLPSSLQWQVRRKVYHSVGVLGSIAK